MTKIIGLTGGIGSGKTTVAKLFMDSGIPVYIADDEAKKLTDLPEIIEQIKNVFGPTVFENGKINRQKLAVIVFNEPALLKKLNAIIHPAVKKHFENWVSSRHETPFVIKETAILFESGSYTDCDLIITVTAPLEIRLQRVLERDQTTRENILKRIQNQWTDEARISKSNFIIENLDLNSTKKQVADLLKKLTIQ